MIKMSNINKGYMLGEEKLPILKDISFSVKKGEYVAILGPSGSGKIKRNKAYKSHILTKKAAKRKRGLRKATVLTSADLKRMLRSMAR